MRTKKDQNIELTDHIEDDQININLQANLAMNAQTLNLAFQKLNESERQLVEMRFISDMSYDEISQVTGRNSGALRVSMTRTLSKLKQIFKDMGITESNI